MGDFDMAGKQRRSFTLQAKKELVKAFESAQTTQELEKLEKQHEVSRYHVYRWRDRFALDTHRHLMPPSITSSKRVITPMVNSISDNKNGSVEQMINQLKIKLADLLLENEQLKRAAYSTDRGRGRDI
jgi:hypothetical protein